MKKTINKQVLKNWIKHTDSQNRVWEESEMWKQRKLETEAEDKRTDKRADKRRKENPPSQKGGEYVSGYWNKKLMELKEKDTSRWGHSGYKELYPEEFSEDPIKGAAKHDKHSKKRHHESSDSDSVHVVSRRRPNIQSPKESEVEKHKKHKKSRHKDNSPLVRDDRERSSRTKENSPDRMKKNRNRSSKVDSDTKQTIRSQKIKSHCNRKEQSSCSDSDRSGPERKAERSRKRVKISPLTDKSSPKKPVLKIRKNEQILDDRNLSSRAAEIRKEIEELEHSVDKKKSKKDHVKSSRDSKPLDAESAETKVKKHKKKRHESDMEKEPLIEDQQEEKVRHKNSERSKEKGLVSSSTDKKRDKAEKQYDIADKETKRKKSDKSERQSKSVEDWREEQPNSRGLSSSKKRVPSKGASEDIHDEAEKLRELAKRSMRNKSSKQNVTKDTEKQGTSPLRRTESENAETKNGYKRLKFRKERSSKPERSPSFQEREKSPKQDNSPRVKKREKSPIRDRSSSLKRKEKSPKRDRSPRPKKKKKSPKRDRSSSLKRKERSPKQDPSPNITRKEKIPKRDRPPSVAKKERSPRRGPSPNPKKNAPLSPNRGASPPSRRRKSPTPVVPPVSELSVSKALEDVRDPMDDFPASGSDNESASEGETASIKEKKSHKKSKKSKKKKKEKKKKKDKKISKSRDGGNSVEEFSLEVSDNFGLCDSVLAFDEIGDID